MAEENNHLTYFKVENFKCFDSFELEDIGQFNLILGDNNVGKTSVLEALLFNESEAENNITNFNLGNLVRLFQLKAKIPEDFIREAMNSSDLKFLIPILYFFLNNQDIKEIRYSLKKGNAIEKNFSMNTEIKVSQTIGYYYYIGLPYIFSNQLYDDDLSSFYSNKIQRDRTRKQNLIKDLKPLIPDLVGIEISMLDNKLPPIIILETSGNNKLIPLASFGDGAIKLFRQLAEIIRNSSSRLMIDEVDSGLHYSRFKDYWRTIIKAAVSNNVQLFMTTHNFECLKYLKEVLEEENMKQYQGKTRSYTLQKLPGGHIKAYKYNFDQFQFSIDQNINIRGGAL